MSTCFQKSCSSMNFICVFVLSKQSNTFLRTEFTGIKNMESRLTHLAMHIYISSTKVSRGGKCTMKCTPHKQFNLWKNFYRPNNFLNRISLRLIWHVLPQYGSRREVSKLSILINRSGISVRLRGIVNIASASSSIKISFQTLFSLISSATFRGVGRTRSRYLVSLPIYLS